MNWMKGVYFALTVWNVYFGFSSDRWTVICLLCSFHTWLQCWRMILDWQRPLFFLFFPPSSFLGTPFSTKLLLLYLYRTTFSTIKLHLIVLTFSLCHVLIKKDTGGNSNFLYSSFICSLFLSFYLTSMFVLVFHELYLLDDFIFCPVFHCLLSLSVLIGLYWFLAKFHSNGDLVVMKTWDCWPSISLEAGTTFWEGEEEGRSVCEFVVLQMVFLYLLTCHCRFTQVDGTFWDVSVSSLFASSIELKQEINYHKKRGC